MLQFIREEPILFIGILMACIAIIVSVGCAIVVFLSISIWLGLGYIWIIATTVVLLIGIEMSQ